MKNLVFLFAAQILIPLLLKAQFTGDPAQPLVICNEGLIQNTVRALTDSSGGYYTFWLDKRNGLDGTCCLWPAS
jgi:hypothetical protein